VAANGAWRPAREILRLLTTKQWARRLCLETGHNLDFGQYAEENLQNQWLAPNDAEQAKPL
jgi:hypothetical protein